MRFAICAVLAACGCDFHERYTPTTPRQITTPTATVKLDELGYFSGSLSTTVEVTNHTDHPVRFDPKGAHLAVGAQATGATTMEDHGDGSLETVATGMSYGAAGAVAGVALAGVDAALLVGINELVRGPYTHFAHVLAPGATGRFTLQFPLGLDGDDACTGPYDPNDLCPVRTPLADNLVLDLGGIGALPLLDTRAPHLGLGQPSEIGGVYEFRIGGGPGLGRVGGTGGIEFAGGPRWGRLAIVGTAQLGYGFPLGAEARWHTADLGDSVHLTSTLGGNYYFFPEGHAAGARAGVELGLDFGPDQLTWPSHALQIGVYARGGPMVFSSDRAVGGELDFGIALGYF